MVIRGKSRGNGKQLAAYLLAQRENDKLPEVLQLRGFADLDPVTALVNTTFDVATVSRSTKPFYHGILNPRLGEAQSMSTQDWEQAANIIEKWLRFEGLPRLIVLHEKKGRTHAHIVWSRLDHQTGRLRPDAYNFYKHNSARADIELTFGHERTRAKRDQTKDLNHRERLTELWKQTEDAASFIAEAQNAGYELGQGLDRRPYRAITPEGKSLDLVRLLDGYKKIDVQARFKGIQLPTEAVALKMHRARFQDKNQNLDRPIKELMMSNFMDGSDRPANDNKLKIFEQLLQEMEQKQTRKRNRGFDY